MPPRQFDDTVLIRLLPSFGAQRHGESWLRAANLCSNENMRLQLFVLDGF